MGRNMTTTAHTTTEDDNQLLFPFFCKGYFHIFWNYWGLK